MKDYYDKAKEYFPAEIVRFLKKVQGDWESGCWNWSSARGRDDYSSFFGGSGTVLGHRWIYAKFRGNIPPGLQLDHLCVRPWCVAPSHLEPVTPEENRRRITFRRDEAKAGRPIVVRTGAATVLELTAAAYFGLPIGGGVVLPGKPGTKAARLARLLPADLQLNPYAQDAPSKFLHQQYLHQLRQVSLEPVRDAFP